MLYLIILITISLDFLITYFIPSYFNNLNLFYPMLTLTLIVFLYQKVENKKYFQTVFITGLIYDFLFSYILLFNSLVFLMFAKIIKKVDKYIRCNFLVSLILLVICIFLYDLILFLLVRVSNYSIVTFNDLIYKFQNSLILNISFYILLNIIFKNKEFKSSKRYSQIRKSSV